MFKIKAVYTQISCSFCFYPLIPFVCLPPFLWDFIMLQEGPEDKCLCRSDFFSSYFRIGDGILFGRVALHWFNLDIKLKKKSVNVSPSMLGLFEWSSAVRALLNWLLCRVAFSYGCCLQCHQTSVSKLHCCWVASLKLDEWMNAALWGPWHWNY